MVSSYTNFTFIVILPCVMGYGFKNSVKNCQNDIYVKMTIKQYCIVSYDTWFCQIICIIIFHITLYNIVSSNVSPLERYA